MNPLENDAYHVYHVWGETNLSTSIGVGLLEATGDLGTPLYEVVDIDALESLLAPGDGDRGTVDQVQFTIEGHTVTVSNHTGIAHIAVHPNGTTPKIPFSPQT